MSLVKRVTHFIYVHQLINNGDAVVVGLSGGPDSVFLVHVLHVLRESMKLRLLCVHLDHEWRPESEHDAQFCACMCARLNIPFMCARASTLDFVLRKNRSKEDRGRQMRRALFEQQRERFGAASIALAHHADDQLETFLVRLARGASVSGLAGMRAHNGTYIRPLLCVHKTEILQYLHEHHIDYVIDASNESAQFLRNRIRHGLIPAMRSTDARFEYNTQRVIGHLRETDEFLTRMTREALVYATKIVDEQILLDLNFLKELDPFLQKRVLVQWLVAYCIPLVLSEHLLAEIMRFLQNKKSANHIFNGWQLVKKHHMLAIFKQ